MKNEIQSAVESIQTVNGYLFDVLCLDENDPHNPNPNVRIVQGDGLYELELFPDEDGFVSKLLRRYIGEVMQANDIPYNATDRSIPKAGEKRNATSKETDCDGSENRNDDRYTDIAGRS